MHMLKKTLTLSVISVAMACGACSVGERAHMAVTSDADSVAAPGLKDGELAVPANYRRWPVFLAGVDKVKAKQIRDIYISPQGHKTKRGDEFPIGTISVMEIWNPKLKADGFPQMSGDGKMIKDSLKLVFVMGKSKGAGSMVDSAQRTGDWVYAGYQADGVTPGGPGASACRGCHITQPDKDWIFRYDEYFAKRTKGAERSIY